MICLDRFELLIPDMWDIYETYECQMIVPVEEDKLLPVGMSSYWGTDLHPVWTRSVPPVQKQT